MKITLNGVEIPTFPTVDFSNEELPITNRSIDEKGYTVIKRQSPDGRSTSETKTKSFKWPK